MRTAAIQFLRWLARMVDAPCQRLRLTRGGLPLAGGAALSVVVSLVALAAVSEDVVAADGLATTDLTEVQTVRDHRTDALIALAKGLSFIGNVPTLGLIGVAAAVLLWLRGERLFVAVAPLVALQVGGLVVGAAKQYVGRERPPVPLRLIAESGGSFPSGHSGDSAALLLTLALVACATVVAGWWARAVVMAGAALLVGLIGLSRIELGVHYPTDVLAGWLTGLVVAIIIGTVALYLRHLANETGANAQLRWPWSWGHRVLTIRRANNESPARTLPRRGHSAVASQLG